MHFYLEKLPLYIGAHIGGVPAVHLKYNYVHMRGGMGQPDHLLLTATEQVWRVGIVFGDGYNVPTLFRNLQKRFLTCREHGTIQTRYPTMVNGQAP